MTHTEAHPHDEWYLPGFGRDWLLPLYDPFSKLNNLRRYHELLLKQAALSPGDSVLEIGCGTGNLLLLAKKLHPSTEFTGIDPDPKALNRAEKKAARAHLDVRFERGFAQRLPYDDDSFDRVLSAFMLHHLPTEVKQDALAEVQRVLRPGGQLHLVDVTGGAHRSHGWLTRSRRAKAHIHDHLGEGIPDRLRATGFADVREVDHRATRFGRLSYFEASL
ncbi:class I SAM-dependent methyltransferase [Hoyosella altamirensis]|uniref:Ubiquinone/menaquinone biosynthesis C-methylase UbiE n=1 Tax=Hoyosella altamirensis TaxID=616997 RepID=A0A839RKD2_9ACTN|nr:class I SAM-dependent methyltransferase [Hoyosella altamirensis]MBB3036857.1 ubiquinone/menaquinone biosynthesis C-methylase UbiE [Hoyosella altamirensis]